MSDRPTGSAHAVFDKDMVTGLTEATDSAEALSRYLIGKDGRST